MNTWKPDYVTNPLDDDDLAVAHIIERTFKNKRLEGKVGSKHAVTNDAIRNGIFKVNHYHVANARLRKIVNYLRCSGRVPDLCANSKGYFIAATTKEMNDYLYDSLYPRIMAQLYMMSKLKQHSRFQGLQEFPFDIEFKDV